MNGSVRLGISPNITDSRWHMLTLTTQPDGGKGYQMYIDGDLVAEMAPRSSPYKGTAPIPLFLDTSVVLAVKFASPRRSSPTAYVYVRRGRAWGSSSRFLGGVEFFL
jgi:hypothetical protein